MWSNWKWLKAKSKPGRTYGKSNEQNRVTKRDHVKKKEQKKNLLMHRLIGNVWA